jgi:hypothetical protein
MLLWLGAYDVPVVVLSATLPSELRRKVVSAYLGEVPKETAIESSSDDPHIMTELSKSDWALTRSYPLITLANSTHIRSVPTEASGVSHRISFEIVNGDDDDLLIARLDELTAGGGCVGIIRNTVKRAQDIWKILDDKFGPKQVILIHSAFISVDRIAIEKKIRTLLGPDDRKRPQRLFVIGTQVLEQSLDIDFDLMCSDLCPMDLLLQRLGREFRHGWHNRPALLQEARCLITGVTTNGCLPEFNKGSASIYGKYQLYNTLLLLETHQYSIDLPDDISDLVQDAYKEVGLEVPSAWEASYDEAKSEQTEKIRDKQARANHFQIKGPDKSLVGWLNNAGSTADDLKAEATVRDITVDTLEVLVVQKRADESLCILPWVVPHGVEVLPRNDAPDDELAKIIASCSINLPAVMCFEGKTITRTIETIERTGGVKAWQRSPWLRGELILVLDENLCAVVNEWRLMYDERAGLSYVKEGENDGSDGI